MEVREISPRLGQMLNYVLVHGAWHGGWCYSRVADRLISRGHRVFAPTLTGLGERSHLFHPAINLTTHVTDIVNLCLWERLEDIVLVGHSYGGMVITGVADRIPKRISHMVYLDAFLPRDGQSLHDLIPAEAAQGQIESDANNRHAGILPIPAELFAVNPADRGWVDSLCTPQPLATFTERLKLSGRGAIRSKHYVLASNNTLGGGFGHFRDSVLGAPAWTTHELACGHDVMIDLPDETALLLERAGRD
jgi:pimeloyl-ACP methyl ester carboxylesterase